jgi:hypothetical protein
MRAATGHNWRRRRQAAPLHLAIVDHDTKRFTIEGPVASDEPWISEIFRARKAGRRIEFSLVEQPVIDEISVKLETASEYEKWPPRSIIVPSRSI